MSDHISLLLVDDHGLVRHGFRRLLEDEPDVRVVGEASVAPKLSKQQNACALPLS